MTLELLGLVAKRVNLLLADGIGTRSPSASMSTARRRTAPSRRARTRWQHSRAFGLATRHLLQCMSSRHSAGQAGPHSEVDRARSGAAPHLHYPSCPLACSPLSQL